MVAGEDDRGREVRARLLRKPFHKASRLPSLAVLAGLALFVPAAGASAASDTTGRLLVTLDRSGHTAHRAQAAAAGREEKAGLDWYSFTVAFKGVLLEGLEVVFIVISFGTAQGELGPAAAGAAVAVVLVGLAGVLVRGPLERVPENTLKYAVGLLLTSFGCFWAAEGAGVDWPGDELSLPVLIAFLALVSFLIVQALRRRPVPLPSGAGA